MEEPEIRNLLLGCGHTRDKRLDPKVFASGLSAIEMSREWVKPKSWRGFLHTLDCEASCKPDIVWDLNNIPWCKMGEHSVEPVRMPDNFYDEIHAYEVLEHIGQLGDFKTFFQHFGEIWRLLKPGGYLCATVPSRKSMWALGDPGHTRVIQPCTLIFLSQQNYVDQQGRTSMTDYRRWWHGDFETMHTYDNGDTHQFILRAVKPSRLGVR